MNDVESLSCGARGATAIPTAAPGRDRDPPAAPPCRAISRTATPYPLPYVRTARLSGIVSESMTLGRFRRVLSVECIHAGGCVCTHRTRHAALAHIWTQRRGRVGCMKSLVRDDTHVQRTGAVYLLYIRTTGCVTTHVGVCSRDRWVRIRSGCVACSRQPANVKRYADPIVRTPGPRPTRPTTRILPCVVHNAARRQNLERVFTAQDVHT